MTTDLASSEYARYLFSRNQYSLQRARVKRGGLLPKKGGGLSVFLIDGCDEPARWALGDTYVAPLRGKPMRSGAGLEHNVFVSLGLTITSKEPPPRHRDVIGWPEEQEKRLEIANELALQARLVTKPLGDQLRP